MISDYAAIALRTILHRRRRTMLTVIGIFIGIAAVVALVSLGQGLQDSVEREFEQIGSNKLFINPGGNQMQGQVATNIRLTGDDLNAVESARGVENAAGIVFTVTPAEFNNDQAFVTVLGMPTGPEKELVETSWAIEIAEGREILSTDTSNVVIGSQVANTMFEDELGVREKLTINGKEFRVVGVMEPTGDPGVDQSVIMPLETAQSVIDRKEGRYDWIFAQVQEGFDVKDVEERVERNLRQSRNVDEGNEDFTVSTQDELLESFNNILSVVRGVVIGIASISLVVGGVNIMNTMYTSVTERTREIGVMKAIGASREQIMTIFLIESGIIGMIGGILGVIVGAAISAVASYGATQATNIQIQPYLGPELIVGALLFSFLVGTVSGVLPARRAARLDPAKALRYE